LAKPFNVAAVATAYFAGSHADVLLSRWMDHRPTDAQWGWNGPRTKLISLHCEQFGERDIAKKTAAEHDLPMFDTVRDALTLGGRELAADGVILIGEHGDYPENEIGQQLYPRKELFDQIVQVFRDTGRSVPVFCDKHYSWNFDWAKEMVQTARDMGFLLFGGSSIPLCRRKPAWPDIRGKRIDEIMAVYYGPWERYGFHSLDYIQQMIEQRAGGESGIRSITAYKGDEVWKQLDAGRWSSEMIDAALSAASEVQPGSMRDNCKKQPPAAHVVEHRDGLRVTHLNLTGHMKEFAAAFRFPGEKTIHLDAPIIGYKDSHHAHFATMARILEDAFLTNTAPFPGERTLLTTGATAGFLRALAQPGIPLATPELAIAYKPGPCAVV
jgi:hypothetical protein